MNRKNIPLVLMLVAGAVTCIVTWVRQYTILGKLTALLITLVVFFCLGSLLRFVLDLFDRQNEKKSQEEGEVIEKEASEENMMGTAAEEEKSEETEE